MTDQETKAKAVFDLLDERIKWIGIENVNEGPLGAPFVSKPRLSGYGWLLGDKEERGKFPINEIWLDNFGIDLPDCQLWHRTENGWEIFKEKQ